MALRRLIPVALLAVVALALVLVLRSDGSDRELRAVFRSATNIVPGLDVRIAGRKIGTIAATDYEGGDAVLKLRIDDGDAWPLRRGTVARLRWATSVGYVNRYVDLEPGPRNAPAIPDGGLLTRAETVAPVEFDELFDVFTRTARDDVKGLLGNLATTLDQSAGDLRRGLRDTPGGFEAVGGVFGDLGADRAALRTLVSSSSRTAAAVGRRDAQLRELLDGAAATFDELGLRGRALEGTLARLPATLRDGRTTLARADRSLRGLDGLVTDLRPGARRLVASVPSAARAVSTLRDVAPVASSALRVGSNAAPEIRGLLAEAKPFVPRLDSVLEQAEPQLKCVRPYAPEIVAFPQLWAGFSKNYDSQAHYVRTMIQVQPFPNGLPLNSKQLLSVYRGLSYAFPRIPGLGAADPWLLPECGAGPDALDAAKDPEALHR